jgi:hypothetical protein
MARVVWAKGKENNYSVVEEAAAHRANRMNRDSHIGAAACILERCFVSVPKQPELLLLFDLVH